ncbi:hypothetical protein ACFL6Q_06215, partial [Candidatus Neomarinimicrobiota bacterium]
YGGGIYAVLSSIVLDNVDIFSNSATGNGGGIKTADSEIILNKVSIRYMLHQRLGVGFTGRETSGI